MRIGSLFSGIGGLDLGLEMAGVGHTVWQVERDPWCRKVLASHWPNAERFDDVCTVGAVRLPPVDVICGGFPCQDLSLAGAGAGLAGERSGLWFEYLRIVSEMRPRFVVVENVPGLLRRGLDVVCAGLADLGFAVEVSRIRAGDLGSPHRRERVFIIAVHRDRVANPDVVRRDGRRLGRMGGEVVGGGVDPVADAAATNAGSGRLADANQSGRRPEQRPIHEGEQGRTIADIGGRSIDRHSEGMEDADGGRCEGRQDAGPGIAVPHRAMQTRAAQPRLGGDADDVSYRLDRHPAGRGEAQHDWEPPRTAYKVPNRPARLKALGNACTPGQAFVVGRRLLERLGEA